MARIINLRTARKRKNRQRAEKDAEGNRVLHSIPKKQRDAAKQRALSERHRLEGHRLEHRDTQDKPDRKD